MKLSIGFNSKSNFNHAKTYEKKDIVYINAYYFIKKFPNDLSQLSAGLSSLMQGLNVDGYILSSSALNLELIGDAEGFASLTQQEIDILKYIMVELFRLTPNLNKIDYFHENLPLPNFSEKKLFIRYGNVELRVIENFIRNKISLLDIKSIISNINNSEFMYERKTEDMCKWLTAADSLHNLKALITNAGFYLPTEHADAATVGLSDLLLWVSKYLKGLSIGSFFSYPGCYPFFFNIQKHLFEQGKRDLEYVSFPSAQIFFQMLEGKTIVFVTPFKKLIDQMISEKRLEKLYVDFDINNINLITIQAPFSIFPTRPDDKWSSSYEKLTNKVDQAFQKDKIDIFMASCGCYGIPITTEVHQKYDCCSIYFGNYLNTLFGIRQTCSENFMIGKCNDELRLDGDLAKYPNLALVDNGRYL
jgi:hypothetical protein